MNPEQFPIFFANMRESSKELVADLILSLDEAMRTGEIRNATYKEMKLHFGRRAEEVWEKHVQSPYFYAGGLDAFTPAVQELYFSINISSIHDYISAAKKLERSQDQSAPVQAMRALVSEMLPLAVAMKSMKEHLVMGRAPRAEPAPVNPNKVVKTCSCCFRGIAVAGFGMAHHGYQRPGDGAQTQSCPGIRYKPLEESLEGLEWMVSCGEYGVAAAKRAVAEFPKTTELRVSSNVGTFNRKAVGVTITREDPRWGDAYKSREFYLARVLLDEEGNLAYLNAQLNKWQSYHEALNDLPAQVIRPQG